MSDGLRLPNTAGPSDADTVEIYQRWNTQPEIEAELAREGFVPLNQPGFVFPIITAELLTSPDNKQYTEMYQCSVAWADYARDKLARTQMTILQQKNTRNEIERMLRRGLLDSVGNAKKPTLKEQQDYFDADPVYANLSLQLQVQEQKELVYASELQRYQDQVKLLSRNVEIRRENWGAGTSNAGQPYRHPYFPQGRPEMPAKMP